MEDKFAVLGHFENISEAFEAVYDGEQESFLYKLVDMLFRKSILKRRLALMVGLCGELKGKKVLDIGCGPGWYALALAQKGPDLVLGIDISPAMIKAAALKTKACGLESSCRFENADFMRKEFKDKFDYIIAAGVFDYIKDPRQFLSKTRGLLGQRAIFSFPVKWTLLTPVRMLWLAKKKCPNFYYSKAEIKKLLRESGLKTKAIYKIGSFMVPGNYIAVCENGGVLC